MVDAEIQALERAVAAGAGADARLRLARALERACRSTEALATLLPGIEDSRVRREIGRLAHEQPRDAGGRFRNVSGLREAPRQLWRVNLAPHLSSLTASPLGLLLHGNGRAPQALDPDTGQRRWSAEREGGEHRCRLAPLLLDDAVVIQRDDHLETRDLWTGDIRSTLKAPAARRAACHQGQVVLDALGEIAAWSWTDCQPTRLWSQPLPTSRSHSRLPVLLNERFLVVAVDPGRILVLDPATGQERWHGPGRSPLADERGVVTLQPDHAVIEQDSIGSTTWACTRRFRQVHALSPTQVLVTISPDGPVPRACPLEVIQRGTGSCQPLALSFDSSHPRSLVATRDVIVGFQPLHGRLEAVSPDGSVLWQLPASQLKLEHITDMDASDQRIFIRGPRGEVICLARA